MGKPRPLRGKALDQALKRLLVVMCEEGRHVSPISISSVCRRLKLGSRNTLLKGNRRTDIRAAARMQLRECDTGEYNQGSITTQLDHLRSENKQLKKDLNSMQALLIQVAINAHRLGYHPEALLLQHGVRDNTAKPSEELWMKYLQKIGLLNKIDPNTRKHDSH